MNNINLEHTNLVIEALTKYKEDTKAIGKKRKIQEVIDMYKEHGSDLEFEESIKLPHEQTKEVCDHLMTLTGNGWRCIKDGCNYSHS